MTTFLGRFLIFVSQDDISRVSLLSKTDWGSVCPLLPLSRWRADGTGVSLWPNLIFLQRFLTGTDMTLLTYMTRAIIKCFNRN